MAAFPGLAMVQMQASLGSGQAVRNTFHIANEGSGVAPDFDELLGIATDIASWFGTAYEGVLDTGSTLVQVLAKQVADPAAGPVALLEAAFPVNHAGSRTADGSAPSQACCLMEFKTPVASRRFRGHLFLPPSLKATDMGGQLWNSGSAYIVACDALNTKFQDGCEPSPSWTGSHLSNYSLVIYSVAAARASEPSTANVQTCAISNTVRWLRSRGRGTT